MSPMRLVHPLVGSAALLTISAFWIATVSSELTGSPAPVVTVKLLIPWGLLLLVPTLAVAGGSGFALARGRHGRRIDAKRRRMRIIAANGLLVLVPSALFLAAKARAGELDAVFYAVQLVELLAGAINITLLGRSLRDGLALTGRWRGVRRLNGVEP